MMKKARKVLMEPSPSFACYHVGEDPRASFRYQYLLQDYEELLKETEVKTKRLQETKQKILTLLAEVKFLQRKYKSLSESLSQRTLHRLKKQFHKTPSRSVGIIHSAKLHAPNGLPFKGKNHSVVQAAKRSTSALIDLNEVSLPSGEDMEGGYQTHAEPLKPATPKRCSMDGGPKDQKLRVCRDVRNNSGRVGKRKITWQDQVALKV